MLVLFFVTAVYSSVVRRAGEDCSWTNLRDPSEQTFEPQCYLQGTHSSPDSVMWTYGDYVGSSGTTYAHCNVPIPANGGRLVVRPDENGLVAFKACCCLMPVQAGGGEATQGSAVEIRAAAGIAHL